MDTDSQQQTTEVSDEQQQALDALNAALGFLILLIAGLVLSYLATVRQRDALCCAIVGDTERAAVLGNVFPMRCKASALTIGASVFFLLLALQAAKKPEATATPAACCSTYRNLWVAVLLLVGALVRLADLVAVERQGTETTEEETVPSL